MGKPAARIGDPHKRGIILEGSADVLIGGLGAARLGDKAQCGNSLDVISEGEATVLINGRAAARQGDRHSCGNVILSGCSTVLIGRDQGQCLKSAAASRAVFVPGWE